MAEGHNSRVVLSFIPYSIGAAQRSRRHTRTTGKWVFSGGKPLGHIRLFHRDGNSGVKLDVFRRQIQLSQRVLQSFGDAARGDVIPMILRTGMPRPLFLQRRVTCRAIEGGPTAAADRAKIMNRARAVIAK